jgi:hypothetical protein
VSDWIEHDAGPQPVADDVWVEVQIFEGKTGPDSGVTGFCQAELHDWSSPVWYRIINQHLIDAAISIFHAEIPKLWDAARLEGIRLGLEAAAREIVERVELSCTTDGGDEWLRTDHMLADIRAQDPETNPKETA